MNRMKKTALIIPVAAMAVMAGNAYAFNSEILEEAGLSEDQIAAFEAAHDLRTDGNPWGARELLEDAGVDDDTWQTIREAMSEHRDAVREAVENDDYDAFMEAIEGGRLDGIITTKAEFDKYVEAQELREAGDYEEAQAILDELGIDMPGRGRGQGLGHYGQGMGTGDGNGHGQGKGLGRNN